MLVTAQLINQCAQRSRWHSFNSRLVPGQKTNFHLSPPRPAQLESTESVVSDTPIPAISLAPPTSYVVPIISLRLAKKTGRSVVLPKEIFGIPVRKDILHRVVTWQLACKRQGTASSKTKGEKAGSGRKIYAQKGTGRARAGQIRSPTRRGGGAAHGPKPRDWKYHLPVKVQNFGLKCALSAKFAHNKLVIIDDTDLESHRTKYFKETLDKFNWTQKSTSRQGRRIGRGTRTRGANTAVLLFDKGPNIHKNLNLAHRNIPSVRVLPKEEINVYDILRYKMLLVHKDALPYLHQKVSTSPVPIELYEHYEKTLEGEDIEEVEQDDLDEFYAKHAQASPKEKEKKKGWFW